MMAKTTMERVIHYLEVAEKVAAGEDVDLNEFNLEPRPIGPCGIRVQEIPFATIPTFWASFQLHTDDFDSTADPEPTVRREVEISAPSLISLDETSITDDSASLERNGTVKRDTTTQVTSRLSPVRYRRYQTGLWNDRYQDLLVFQEQHGHLLVPHSYKPNQKLSQWVKRYDRGGF
jgi:hypothetical protein